MKQARKLIEKGNVVAFTGAGISVESGVPPFRGEKGLWEKYDPNIYVSLLGLSATFLVKPKKVAAFVNEIYETVLNASPNPGHLSFARLEETGILNSIITHNIDSLHQEAGNKKVIEPHGNLFCLKCLKCGKRKKMAREEIVQMRPDIVLFGEALLEETMESSFDAIDSYETFLMIVTSGTIYPAASLSFYARKTNKKIVETNKGISSLSEIADFKLRVRSSQN